MKLIEAILEGNRKAPEGKAPVELAETPPAEALPVVGLTCVDPRLNALLPMRLGLPADQFIWLRSAGNIVTIPTGNMVRSLALACAVKRAKEVLVIGHTDCAVCKATMLQLTESFKALGVRREDLPDDLVEFFGLFASERQNVMRAVEVIRSSPLLGPKVPVHGLLMDIVTGRLERVVDGYAAAGAARTVVSSSSTQPTQPTGPTPAVEEKASPSDAFKAAAAVEPSKTAWSAVAPVKDMASTWTLPEMKLGPLQLPQIEVTHIELPKIKIGDATLDPQEWLKQRHQPEAGVEVGSVSEDQAKPSPESLFDKARRYKVIGSDHKVYGPINGLKILQWITEGRIGWDTPSQMEGSQEWRPLEMWAELAKKILREKTLPPHLPGSPRERRR